MTENSFTEIQITALSNFILKKRISTISSFKISSKSFNKFRWKATSLKISIINQICENPS